MKNNTRVIIFISAAFCISLTTYIFWPPSPKRIDPDLIDSTIRDDKSEKEVDILILRLNDLPKFLFTAFLKREFVIPIFFNEKTKTLEKVVIFNLRSKEKKLEHPEHMWSTV